MILHIQQPKDLEDLDVFWIWQMNLTLQKIVGLISYPAEKQSAMPKMQWGGRIAAEKWQNRNN